MSTASTPSLSDVIALNIKLNELESKLATDGTTKEVILNNINETKESLLPIRLQLNNFIRLMSSLDSMDANKQDTRFDNVSVTASSRSASVQDGTIEATESTVPVAAATATATTKDTAVTGKTARTTTGGQDEERVLPTLSTSQELFNIIHNSLLKLFSSIQTLSENFEKLGPIFDTIPEYTNQYKSREFQPLEVLLNINSSSTTTKGSSTGTSNYTTSFSNNNNNSNNITGSHKHKHKHQC